MLRVSDRPCCFAACHCTDLSAPLSIPEPGPLISQAGPHHAMLRLSYQISKGHRQAMIRHSEGNLLVSIINHRASSC